MNFKKIIVTLLSIVSVCSAIAQTEGVSIKSTLGPPNPNAMLDVESTNKGVLIPRVALVSLNSTQPIANSGPLEKGLMVYNTNESYTTPTNQSNGLQGKGFYYWNTAKWVKIGQGSDVPKMTYDQMRAMLPYLSLDDRGMFVYVITRQTAVYQSPGLACTFGAEIHGLWFLSSYYCNATTEYLVWERVKYDYGTPNGNASYKNPACGVPAACQSNPNDGAQ